MRRRVKRDAASQALQVFRCFQSVADGHGICAARLFDGARQQLKRITGHVAVRCNVHTGIIAPTRNKLFQQLVDAGSLGHARNVKDDPVHIVTGDLENAAGHGTFRREQRLRDAKLTRLVGDQADLLVVASCHIQAVKVARFLDLRQNGTVIHVTGVIGLLGDDRTAGCFHGSGILTADAQRKVTADLIDDRHILVAELFNGVLAEDRTALRVAQAGAEPIGPDLSVVGHGDLGVCGHGGNDRHFILRCHIDQRDRGSRSFAANERTNAVIENGFACHVCCFDNIIAVVVAQDLDLPAAEQAAVFIHIVRQQLNGLIYDIAPQGVFTGSCTHDTNFNRIVSIVGLLAARAQRQHHRDDQKNCCQFFH